MSCLSFTLYIIALIWTLVIPWGQVITNFMLSSSLTTTGALFAVLPIIQAVLLILPILPFAIFLRNHILQAIFQTWMITAVVGVIFAPIQVVHQSSMQIRAVIGIVLGCICILLIFLLSWLKHSSEYLAHIKGILQPIGNIHLILIFSVFFSYGWLVWGSLGSLIDTVLMLLNAVIYGILIALILDHFLFLPLEGIAPKTIGTFLISSSSAGIALLIFISGLNFPFGGMQILMMISLPGTAWIAFALHRYLSEMAKNPLLAVAIIFVVTFSLPMLFVDPDELALVINATKGEIGTWAIYAALVSLGVSCLFGAGVYIWQITRNRQVAKSEPFLSVPALKTTAVIIFWGIGAVLYVSVGQPGWHGEQLFVILKDQKVITQAASLDNYQDRRQLVYDSLVQHAEATQSGLRSILDRLGVQYQPYYLVNSLQVDGGPLLRLWLMTRPEVDRVLDSPHLRPLPEELPQQQGSESLPSGLEWNITQIQADQVWQDFNVTGEGIVIGQSDSGVQWDHPELIGNYRGKENDHNYNWLDPWGHTLEPADKNGHGTHTLGTILGSHTGIAPGATWFACANLVRNLGNPAFYLECMQFMLAPYPFGGDSFTDGDPTRGADILNNSWGCPDLEGCDTDTFLYAVRNLRAAGIFVVASAGNDGPHCGTINYPIANYPELFSVGAIDQKGELAFFSSIGPAIADKIQLIKPDLIAPGVDILSSMPGNTYGRNTGTSMAGPHVVGVVALMWSANPNLIGDIQSTTQILIDSAGTYHGTLPDCPGAFASPSTVVGYGVLNAYRAVELALQMK